MLAVEQREALREFRITSPQSVKEKLFIQKIRNKPKYLAVLSMRLNASSVSRATLLLLSWFVMIPSTNMRCTCIYITLELIREEPVTGS